LKTCTRCKKNQTLDSFYKDKKRKDGLTCHCKACNRYYANKVCKSHKKLVSKVWKDNNPDKLRAMWIKQIYNLSWEDYEALLLNQKGVCAICEVPLKLHKGIEHLAEVAHVDHCHTTGNVRGLLCSNCNTAIGLLKDSESLLKKAIKYLGES